MTLVLNRCMDCRQMSKPLSSGRRIHVSDMAFCSCLLFAGEQKKKELEEAAAKVSPQRNTLSSVH